MSLYAAYGNLDARLMTRRAPHSPMRATGWLNGWRLTFGGEHMGWEGALATIVEDPLSQVFVALYDIAPLDEESMDRWEGVGLGVYRRMRVRVHTLEGEEAGVDLRPRRLRGRPPVGTLPGRGSRRRRVCGSPARLRDGTPQAPLLSTATHSHPTGPSTPTHPLTPPSPAPTHPPPPFVGNDKTTIANP